MPGAEATLPVILAVGLILGLIRPSTFVMPLFRKSKQSADLSVSTSTPPTEVMRDLASQRNSGALALFSAVIALSISSPSHTRGTSSDGATILGRDTGWQIAYGAARIAVELGKESSDSFLPVKAVVGAVSTLVKNYDVSGLVCNLNTSSSAARFPLQQKSDNMEGVKEIEQRLQSLSGVLASPPSGDNYAEKERRVEFQRFVPMQVYVSLPAQVAHLSCRKLEGVIAKLKPLSEQQMPIDFSSDVNNTKTLTGLVQELANAITDYQV